VVVVQHSAAQRLVNHTKIRSGCVVRITLAHPVRAIPEALAAVQHVLDALAADGEWGPLLLEPPRLLGVQDLLPAGVVLSMQLVTVAGAQWRLRRALLREIAEALQTAGIPLAHWPELPLPGHSTPGS
jgi:small conductance mechanosensitive channel